MWDAAFSDANMVNGCNYAQQAASILKTGSPCGGSGTTTSPTPTTTSTSAATSSGTVTGTPVAQWGQASAFAFTWSMSSI
jgi:chitinase